MRIVKSENILKRVFHDLTGSELLCLSNFIIKKTFKPNELILTQGSLSDYLYIIEKGEVKCFVTLPGDTIREAATLSKPHVFGELEFLAEELALATVTAKTDVSCILLKRSILNAMWFMYPEIASKIEWAIVKKTSHEIVINSQNLLNFLLPMQVNHTLHSEHAHTLLNPQAQYKEININSLNRQLLSRMAFFTVLNESQMDSLLTRARVFSYEKGYPISLQNLGKIYLVFSGAVMFFLTKEDALIKALGIMGISELFLQRFCSPSLNSFFKFLTCEESIIVELDIDNYCQLRHLNKEIFYKISHCIYTALVRWFYVINQQVIRINCEYGA